MYVYNTIDSNIASVLHTHINKFIYKPPTPGIVKKKKKIV